MLPLARLFVAVFLGALMMAGNSLASFAEADHDHSGVATSATQLLDTNAGANFIAAKSNCDRAGQGNCCSHSCGQATCSLLAFTGPEAFQFEAPSKMAFSPEPGRLLSPRAVLGLIKPPQVVAI
jgi:hypothetical protein